MRNQTLLREGRNNALKPVTVEKNMKYAEYEVNVKKQRATQGWSELPTWEKREAGSNAVGSNGNTLLWKPLGRHFCKGGGTRLSTRPVPPIRPSQGSSWATRKTGKPRILQLILPSTSPDARSSRRSRRPKRSPSLEEMRGSLRSGDPAPPDFRGYPPHGHDRDYSPYLPRSRRPRNPRGR